MTTKEQLTFLILTLRCSGNAIRIIFLNGGKKLWCGQNLNRMPVDVLDVLLMIGDKDPHVVVRVTDCSAKIIPIHGRKWQDRSTIFAEDERGHNISPNTEIGDWIKRLGRIHPSQLKIYERTIEAPKKDLGYVNVPFPGTVPKLRKPKVTVQEISDEFNLEEALKPKNLSGVLLHNIPS